VSQHRDHAALVEARLAALVPFGSLGPLDDPEAVLSFERDAPTGVLNPIVPAVARAVKRLRDAPDDVLDVVAEEIHAIATLARATDEAVANELLDWLDNRRAMPRHATFPPAPRDRATAIEHYVVPLVPGASRLTDPAERLRLARTRWERNEIDETVLLAFEAIDEPEDRYRTAAALRSAGLDRAASALMWGDPAESVREWRDAALYEAWRIHLRTQYVRETHTGALLMSHPHALQALIASDQVELPHLWRSESSLELFCTLAIREGRDDLAIEAVRARRRAVATHYTEKHHAFRAMFPRPLARLVLELIERHSELHAEWLLEPYPITTRDQFCSAQSTSEDRQLWARATRRNLDTLTIDDIISLDDAGHHDLAVEAIATTTYERPSLGWRKMRRHRREDGPRMTRAALLHAEASLLRGDHDAFHAHLATVDWYGTPLSPVQTARRLELEIVASTDSTTRNALMRELAAVAAILEDRGQEVAWSVEVLRDLRDAAPDNSSGRAIALHYARRVASYPDLSPNARVDALLDLAERLEAMEGNDAALTEALVVAAEIARDSGITDANLAALHFAIGRNTIRRDGATDRAHECFTRARELAARGNATALRLAADAFITQFWGPESGSTGRSIGA